MDQEIEARDSLGEVPKRKGFMKETVHSMLRRCEGWDYSLPCMYMITVVLANRRSRALGEVRGSVIGDNIADHRTRDNIADHRTRDHRTPPISPQLVRCELTALGKAVEECWEACFHNKKVFTEKQKDVIIKKDRRKSFFCPLF